MRTHPFPRKQRLRGFGSFTRIMSGGISISAGPLRCFVVSDAASTPAVRTGFAVSKSVRGSVRRNRMRRLMREAYRACKEPLIEAARSGGLKVEIVVLYTGPAPAPGGRLRRNQIDEPMNHILHKIIRRL